jgi:hypothetical protein
MKYKNEEITEEQINYIITDRQYLIRELTDEIINTAKLNKKISLYEGVIAFLAALSITATILLIIK